MMRSFEVGWRSSDALLAHARWVTVRGNRRAVSAAGGIGRGHAVRSMTVEHLALGDDHELSEWHMP
jgi:hypothetical protein